MQFKFIKLHQWQESFSLKHVTMSDPLRQNYNAIEVLLPLFNGLQEKFIKLHQIKSSVNCEMPPL